MGVIYLVVLDRLLRVTTKKGCQLFWGKKWKSAPQTKSWLRPCAKADVKYNSWITHSNIRNDSVSTDSAGIMGSKNDERH